MNWWQSEENFVKELSAEEDGVERIYSRQDEAGVWEYAIVRWRYGQATLIYLLRDGKAYDEEGDRI